MNPGLNFVQHANTPLLQHSGAIFPAEAQTSDLFIDTLLSAFE